MILLDRYIHSRLITQTHSSKTTSKIDKKRLNFHKMAKNGFGIKRIDEAFTYAIYNLLKTDKNQRPSGWSAPGSIGVLC